MADTPTTISSLYQCLFSGRQLPFIVTFNILRCNFANQMLSSSNSNSLHAMLVFLVPVLLNLIEIKYQGKFISPFETHPCTTMTAIISLLVYCLAFVAAQTLPSTYASVSRYFMTFSSSLSLVSLARILFPESMRYVLYVSYLLLSMGEVYSMIQKLYSWFQKTIIAKFVNQFHLRRPPLLPRSSMDARYLQLQL